MPSLFHGLGHEIAYAIRRLREDKTFTLLALFTLVLALGINTALFSIIYAVLLREPPVEGIDRVVMVFNESQSRGIQFNPVSVFDYQTRNDPDIFEAASLMRVEMAHLTRDEQVNTLIAQFILPDYHQVYPGVVTKGREMRASDLELDAPPVVLLAEQAAEEHFPDIPNLVGQEIILNGQSTKVVGLISREVSGGPIAFLPYRWTEKDAALPMDFRSMMVGRLHPNVSVEEAEKRLQQLDTEARAGLDIFQNTFGREVEQWNVNVVRSSEFARNLFGRHLLLLQIGATLVLLIGCVNIANLTLSRQNERTKELAVRYSLGAGRWHLFRQSFIESALLVIIGSVLSLFAAIWAIELLDTLMQRFYTFDIILRLDFGVLIFATLVTAGAIFIVGMVPAIRIASSNLLHFFAERGYSHTAGKHSFLLQGGLVVTQVALTLSLLAAATAATYGIAKIMSREPGLRIDGIVSANVLKPGTGAAGMPAFNPTANPEKAAPPTGYGDLSHDLVSILREDPQIEAAALSWLPPFTLSRAFFPFHIPSRPLKEGEQIRLAPVNAVDQGFFPMLEIKLLAGRNFSPVDIPQGAPPAVIVDRHFVQQWFATENDPDPSPATAVGQILRFDQLVPEFESGHMTIIGVVENHHYHTLDDMDINGRVYFNLARQSPQNFALIMDTGGDTDVARIATIQALRGMDSELRPGNFSTLERRINASTRYKRDPASILILFALTATLLSILGVHGVISYQLSLRTREIAIRRILGAGTPGLTRMIIYQNLRPVLIGLGLGSFLAWGALQLMGQVITNLERTPLPVLALVYGVFVIIATGATLPALRRILQLDPATALRDE